MTSKNRPIKDKGVATSNPPTSKFKNVILFYQYHPKRIRLPSSSICSPSESATDKELPISPDKIVLDSNLAVILLPLEIIAKNFAMLRNRKGVNLKEVADTTKISLYRLKKLEQGKLRICPSVLLVLSDYFGVLMFDLIEDNLADKQIFKQQ